MTPQTREAPLVCQIQAIVDLLVTPAAGYSAEELSAVLSALKRADMAISDRFHQLLNYLPDDGRAA